LATVTLTPDEALATPLLHHGFGGPPTSIELLADSLVGLHNTSPVGPYLSLRARLEGFSREDLDSLMYRDWKLARFRGMRMTLFVFPLDLLEVVAAATGRLLTSLAARWVRDSGLSLGEFESVSGSVEDQLQDGPLTVRELRERLVVPDGVDLPGVVARMCDVGRLAGGQPPRSWRSPVRRYHRWNDVLPDVDLMRWDETAATAELIGRYIRSYGPVTMDDVAWWTGLTRGRCHVALDNLGVEVVEVPGWPGPLYRLPGDASPTEVATSEVQALPALDPYVQGYRDRERLMDPARFDFVYDGGGNSAATLVCRGRVIGVWQTQNKPVEAVRYHLFADEPDTVRKMAEEDLASAGAMYFDREVDVIEVTDMTSLRAGGRSAMHPLDETVHRASRRSLPRL